MGRRIVLSAKVTSRPVTALINLTESGIFFIDISRLITALLINVY